MKKLITSNITGTVKQPIRKITLDHLQQAHQEILDALCKAIITDSSLPYILFGCANTGSGLHYIVSAGAVYYNGEVYLTDAVDITATGSNVLVGLLDTTYPASDPTTFTDGNSYNVHAIRKIKWQAGASGSQLFNYSDVKTVADFKFIDKASSLIAYSEALVNSTFNNTQDIILSLVPSASKSATRMKVSVTMSLTSPSIDTTSLKHNIKIKKAGADQVIYKQNLAQNGESTIVSIVKIISYTAGETLTVEGVNTTNSTSITVDAANITCEVLNT